jgi:hypothetical protein
MIVSSNKTACISSLIKPKLYFFKRAQNIWCWFENSFKIYKNFKNILLECSITLHLNNLKKIILSFFGRFVTKIWNTITFILINFKNFKVIIEGFLRHLKYNSLNVRSINCELLLSYMIKSIFISRVVKS